MPDFKENFAEAFKQLWKELLAEFIGTLFLVFVGCGSTVGGKFSSYVSYLEIALCFGLTVGVVIHIIGHISGGHINPAVTIGMLTARKIPIYKGIFFIVAQVAGGIAGAALLLAILPQDMHKKLGLTKVHKMINYGQALLIEFLITFLLVFGVFMVFDPRKNEARHEPMVIGLIVGTCHIYAIKFTGSSMNPARSFGPALMALDFADHWVYWVGPILGGIAAAVMYKFVYEPPESSAENDKGAPSENIPKVIEEDYTKDDPEIPEDIITEKNLDDTTTPETPEEV